MASIQFIPGRRYRVIYRVPGELQKEFIGTLLEIQQGGLLEGDNLLWDLRPEAGTATLRMWYVVDAEMVPNTVPHQVPYTQRRNR